MAAHIHAELMRLFAEDAMETDTPWERWQMKTDKGDWIDYEMPYSPNWNLSVEYRRKPKKIRIGKYDVPEPLRVAPDYGDEYYVAAWAASGISYCWCSWEGARRDLQFLEAGLIHSTPEAAQYHIDAILSLTRAKK
jgi:hypothetical protein